MNKEFTYHQQDSDCYTLMPAAPAMMLDAPYQDWLEQGDTDSYLAALEHDGPGWWFDTDIPRLVTHLMPLQTPAFEGCTLPPRIQLLATVAQPVIDVTAVRALCDLMQADGDYEAASVAAGAGVAAVWDSGRRFSDYAPWYETVKDLLDVDDLSAHAQASLYGFKGLVELTGHATFAAASESYSRQRMLAEQAGSNALLVFGTAADAYCHFYSGRLDAGEIMLADACTLVSAGGITHVAYVYLLSCMGLYDVVLGRAQRAQEYLEKLTAQEWYDLLPPSVWVSGLGHLLTALAWCGVSDTLEVVANRLRQRVIPEYHAFYHCYSHYNLGVVTLQLGQAHRALQHAEISIERSLASESPLSAVVPEILRIQALSDLNRDAEALEYLDAWEETWGASEFRIFAAICALERAHLLLRASSLEEAKASFQRARELVSPDVAFPQIGRDEAFFKDIQARLASASNTSGAGTDHAPPCDRPVVIETLGDLRMQIGDKSIYDKQWRGRKSKLLLLALIINGGSKVSTALLADLLWPDSDGDTAARNLKVTISRLRKVAANNDELSESWLVVKQGQVSLVRSLCWVDAIEFKQRVSAARDRRVEQDELRNSLELYHGDFMANNNSETWIVGHREKLRETYIGGVRDYARRCLDMDQGEQSLGFLQKALNLDPLNEPLYALLMRVYLAQGYPAQALATYHQAQAVLREAFGVAPGDRLTALAQQADAAG